MEANHLMIIGLIPATLIVLVSAYFRQLGKQYFLLILLATNVILLSIILFAGWTRSEQASWQANMRITQAMKLLMPSIVGVLTLIILNNKILSTLRRREKLLAIVLGTCNIVLLIGIWLQGGSETLTIILSGGLTLLLVWGLARAVRPTLAVFILLSLLFPILCNATLSGRLDLSKLPQLPSWLSPLYFVILYAFPGLVIVTAAALLSSGLKQINTPTDTISRPSQCSAFWHFFLATLLFAGLLYTLVWTSIWDQTVDMGLGTFLLPMLIPISIATGMVITITNANRQQQATGIAFAALVPLGMMAAMTYGSNIDYHTLTESRAARIQEAVEHFHTHTGGYPTNLDELVPREIWWIPNPIILSGQTWCYQGGDDFYRLGAIFREFWSTPFSIQIYASAGSPPTGSWKCEERLAELKTHYGYSTSVDDVPPSVSTLEPLPTSIVGVSRTSIHPIMRSSAIRVGKWSPDGNYLLFGLVELAGEQAMIKLNFLNAKTGEICPASEKKWNINWMEDGLRQQYAWLPDGRLLFVSENGEMPLFTPCVNIKRDLANHYSTVFTQLPAYDESSGQALLKSEDAYWILNGSSLEVLKIENVNPNPYEMHWDQYAWLEGGKRLAIARLNGRKKEGGTTLYIINGNTAAVEKSVPLARSSDQSAPWIAWLTNDKLLIHSDSLFEMDFRTEPASLTNIVADVFSLKISYPNDVWSMSTTSGNNREGYYIALRVNTPDDQSIYLYHSQTDQIDELQSSVGTFIFLPDGQSIELMKPESSPSDQDEYDLIWMNKTKTETERLTVEGHNPRHYPTLFAQYLPGSSRIIFSSSQGISMMSVPDGKLLNFWELVDGENTPSTSTLTSPNEKTLVVIVPGVGLYYIPLPDK